MKKTLAAFAGLALAGAALAQVNPTQPMVTGRGNVGGYPGKVILANQTATTSDVTIKLEKFVVTGSLMNHQAAKVVPRK